MATTRVVRYIENSTYQWVPTITTASVITASPHAHTGVPTGSPFQTDWVDTGSNRECTMLGLGNVESGNPPNQNLFPTNREDGTTAFPDSIDGGNEIRVARYPTTFKITATWPTITADDVLVDHSTGISKTRSSARIQSGGSIRWGARYDELLTGQSLHGEFSGRFRYSTRMHPPAQNAPITDYDETRNGGSSNQASQSLFASQPLTKLFITGSDNITTTTGTTTNDITLSANHNDFTGKTFAADYQNTITDDTSGGPFQVRVRVSESLFASNSDSNVNIQRQWEALDIVINGSDNDHTLPPLSATTTLTPLGGLLVPGSSSASASSSMSGTAVVKKIASAGVECAFTSNFTSGLKFIITSTEVSPFAVSADVLGALTPQIFGSASVASAFTTTTSTTNILGPTLEMSTSITVPTPQGNVISDITGDYTWNSLSNNPFVDSGYVKGGYTTEAEYSWDDLTTDDWENWTYGTWLGDETSWDTWPNDEWFSPFKFETEFTQPNTVPAFLVGGTLGASTAFTFSEDVAFLKASVAELTTALTFDATASGVIDITVGLSASFSTSVSDVDYLENITADEIETFAAAFTTTITANVKSDTFANIDGALGFVVSDTVIYGALSTPPSAFTTDFIGNLTHSPEIALSASLAKTVVAFLNSPADFFNTHKVEQETRALVVPVESRQYIINKETRLNNINAESRVYDVEQETKTYTIPRHKITNIFTTPKTRSK